jgi:hypothetical protein
MRQLVFERGRAGGLLHRQRSEIVGEPEAVLAVFLISIE